MSRRAAPPDAPAGRTLRGRFEDARRARRRLGRDPEALHDFRVALRRLSVLVADLGPAAGLAHPKRWRRRLRRLARATNAVRDGEVHRDWLLKAGAPGRLLAERLEESLAAERGPILREAGRVFDRLVPAWERAWASPRDSAPPRDRLDRRTIKAAEALARRWRERPRDWHRIRVAGKRLRYLLELSGSEPGADRLLRRLRRFQNRAGAWHDLETLPASVGKLLADDPALAAAWRQVEPAWRRERGRRRRRLGSFRPLTPAQVRRAANARRSGGLKGPARAPPHR